MNKPIGYVLGGLAPPDVLATSPDRPSFEFHRFVERADAELLSLSSIGPAGTALGGIRGRKLYKQFALAFWVARRANRYRGIIASGEDIGVPMGLAFRALGVRTPLVIILHGPQLQSPQFRLLFRLVKSVSTVAFACLSASLRDLLVTRHGGHPARCFGTGYGIDTDFFTASGRPSERIIASAGSSNRDYGTLIAAVEPLDLEVRIAADSTWVKTDVAAGLTVPANVKMRSYGNYANLRDLYDRSRFIVVPTHDAPFASGFAVIGEAMAMGKPVIATRGQVISDFLVEGKTGITVPPGDATALREAILRLTTDDALVERMGKAASARMRTEYSLDAYCGRLDALVTRNQWSGPDKWSAFAGKGLTTTL